MVLRHMPSTPMTQKEMEAQCKVVSKAADCDPGEEHEEKVLRRFDRIEKLARDLEDIQELINRANEKFSTR